MTFLNIPIKSVQVSVDTVVGIESMAWYNPTLYPVVPPALPPAPSSRDFRWRIEMTVDPQTQSYYLSRAPGLYNGQDIYVGMWIANLVTGQAWQIISIDAKTSSSITAVVQDIYRYNTFRDTSVAGNGSPNTGTYVAFSLSSDGFPQIDPAPPAGTSASFSQNLNSRFEYSNLQYNYSLYQQSNSFALNDVIAASSSTNSFVLTDSTNKVVVGRVTSISDTVSGWFTINPVQKIVDNLNYLPGLLGDIIYTSIVTPGEITTAPGGAQIYVKLRNNTSSTSRSTAQGPTTAGNVLQLNGVDVTIGGTGTEADFVTATNLQTSLTGVTASLQLSYSIVQTNPGLLSITYGEPALWAATSPATATINGSPVTFNVLSTDVGYEDYSRAPQMAQAINAANIPNIVASVSGPLVLVVTNLTGGSITIVNGTSDINGVPFGGTLSGSGLVLITSASITNIIEFVAVDARPINFLNVLGDPVADFGLISVENGVKAVGLYIEEGLREASTVVVANLTQLNALTPLIGDQAYVIDSDDGNGNNVGEWSMWLYDGSMWVETSNQDSASTDAKSIEYTLTTASPVSINIGTISTGRRVSLITVEVITPFDAASTVDIGYQVNNPVPPPPEPDGLMIQGIIDLTVAGTYTTYTDILFGTDTVQGDVSITAEFTLNGSTVGEAQIIVSYV